MTRPSLTGHQPVVEFRSYCNHFFICYPQLGVELAPAFVRRETADEIGNHCAIGTPFFTAIPTVPYDFPFPRPNIHMPRQRFIILPFVTR